MESYYIVEHVPHLQMNFHQQNYLYSVPPALGGSNSQFPHHSTSGRYYNFLQSMPTYNHTSGPQGYGLSAAIHNPDPSVQEGYTSFPSHPPTWDQIPHLQRNFDGLRQNCLSNWWSTIEHNNSHLPNHGISRSNNYFRLHMSDSQNGMMSNYAPRSYGLPASIHNHNPSLQNNSYTNLAAHQPRRYLVEQHSVIEDGEIRMIWKSTELAQTSFSHGISAHEGSMETREMRRMPYPENEMDGFVDSHMHPSYTCNYQLHPNQQLPHMQPMRGNNLNLQPQMPSSSPHWHEMGNPQALYSSQADNRNRNFESSMPVDQMNNQENLPSEDNMLDLDRLTIQLVDDVIVLEAFDVDAYLRFADEDGLLSYEELIDLEEQMGHENTGLSEEEIQRHLKKRTYLSSANQFDLNEAPPSKTSRISVNQLDLNEACSNSDEEPDICVICQVEYESRERIGTLECGHEYHANCITKWLQEKNVCPVCKATALSIKS
ncbi:hypothetical protein RHMOL_Rhmol04G0101500 [Rhododendron molle]|uniref:Uncharacterized protein n=1 Tax=Rhododendron molle TaxID=49168 RepID=A0ACC0P0J7_RHOML|nr:hypothetical protein RHMOL_Rhmol04G0101500 [Rhododendron molle]